MSPQSEPGWSPQAALIIGQSLTTLPSLTRLGTVVRLTPMLRREDRWLWVPATALLIAGVALRAFILTHSHGTADADEAVSGLITRHFVSHPTSLPVFMWGTNYAGTLEPALTAIAFAVFGSSILALKLTIVVLHVGACLLLWRVGRRLVDERAGVLAACALWVWPGVSVWWSTKARDYEVLLVCGLLTLLLALRVIEDPKRRRDWLGLGAAVGVGWWTNPQIAFLAVPAALWILMGNRRALRYAPNAVPGFVVGAAPWIIWNLRNGWGSFVSQFPNNEGYLDHLRRFWGEGLPVLLGLRTPFYLRYAVPRWHALFLALALAAGLSLVLIKRPGARYLAVALVAYPMVHALLPVANFTGEARYLYLYTPILALVVARAVRHPLAIAGAFGVMLAFTVGTLTTITLPMSAGSVYERAIPAKLAPVIKALEAEKIDTVMSDYWIAYRLTFESRERIVGAGVPANRYQPYLDYFRSSRRSAWLFIDGAKADQNFKASMVYIGVPYRTVQAGGFAVHIPVRPVLPEEVMYQ